MTTPLEGAPRRPWQARWIWAGPSALVPVNLQSMRLDAERARRFVLLRRRLELDAVPPHAPVRVTADSRYVLWINGTEVSRGPVRGNPSLLRYDEVDAAAHLCPGSNVVAAVARFYGTSTPWWRPVAPTWGLGSGAFLFEAEVGDQVVVSDRSWKALVSDSWTAQDGSFLSSLPIELVDGRGAPEAWQQPSFDDGSWEAASELAVHHVGFPGSHHPPTHPYGPLLARPVPMLTDRVRRPRHVSLWTGEGADAIDDPVLQVEADEHRVAPARLDLPAEALPLEVDGSTGISVVQVDFGEIVAGTVVLEVDAPEGTRIDAMLAEGTADDGSLRRDEQHAGFRYITRGGPDRFETFDLAGLRHVGLSIRSDGPMTVDLSVRERIFPRPEGSFFRCSDPLLDDVWRAGRRTVDACSFDSYVDCPTREQRAWTGDAVVHQMVDLASNPDWRLAQWHVEMTAASQRGDGMLPMAVAGDIEQVDVTVLPDWALHWVRSLHNLWRYTGDRSLVLALLSTAEQVVRWFLPFQGRDGLLHDVTGWVLVDWSAVSTSGTSSALNALWARAFRDVHDMARWLGDEGRASWALDRWHEVSAAFDSFWDAGREVYVDHLEAGPTGRVVSQHGNAAALAAGLVPDDRVDTIVDLLTDRGRLVHASWLRPGSVGLENDPAAMYDGSTYLFTGPPEPWWDVERGVVAAQPFFRYVVHDAVAAGGASDRIADLCRDWEVLLDRCETSLSETWFGGTHCHGWSATPTRDLLVRTLGVEPAEPGWTLGRVAPRLGDLEWAEGAVATPRGFLHLRVDGSSIEIDTPVPVLVDRNDGVHHHLEPGTHTLP